ncbi:MAG: Fe-S-containing hydro-lyase [Abditibacteriota bacterium]|nr:Fe-S-containing hydro-lyase [Abditibacteriota bacterium]
MRTIRLTAPLTEEAAAGLRAGDRVLLSGTIYTARDAAHARLTALIREGRPLPIPLEGQIIYYAGPTPAKPGRVIGSAGPTTSGRMDPYAPLLLERGLGGMIGKGRRSPAVREACAKYGAVYFAATGGAAALLSRCITACEITAWEDLGCEAVRKLTVKELPLVVINDVKGNDFYSEQQVTK